MEICLTRRAIERMNQRQKKVGKNGIRLCKSDIIARVEKLTFEHNAGNPPGIILRPTKQGIA